jgi:hypothetical protein
MPTVTGQLSAAGNNGAVAGSVDVMLCGYGSQVPRVVGQSLVAEIETMTIQAGADGRFSFTCAANDQISPAGTFYTVRVRDANGDTAQINAYRFNATPAAYDLNTLAPIDPNIPPAPLPPPAPYNNWLWVMGNPPQFDGSQYTTLGYQLPDNDSEVITPPAMTGIIPGNLYTFFIAQNAQGIGQFHWPPNIHNGTDIPFGALFGVTQTFVATAAADALYAIGPGAYDLA